MWKTENRKRTWGFSIFFCRPQGPFLKNDAGLVAGTAGLEPLLPLRIIDLVLQWTKPWQWTESEPRGQKRQEKPGQKLDLGAFSGLREGDFHGATPKNRWLRMEDPINQNG